MQIALKTSYVLEVTAYELRLISAALQGNLKEEWKEDALELQDKIFQGRNKEVKNKMETLAKHGKEDE